MKFYNNGNYDLYLGTGAGKKLLQDIQDAKESIKIISPYLSPYLTKELINLHNKNVNIQLITSDDIKDKENIYDLILQNKYINEESVKNRVLLNKKKFIFKFLSIVTIILSATIYFFNQNIFLSIFFTFSSFCSFYFFKKIEVTAQALKK